MSSMRFSYFQSGIFMAHIYMYYNDLDVNTDRILAILLQS